MKIYNKFLNKKKIFFSNKCIEPPTLNKQPFIGNKLCCCTIIKGPQDPSKEINFEKYVTIIENNKMNNNYFCSIFKKILKFFIYGWVANVFINFMSETFEIHTNDIKNIDRIYEYCIYPKFQPVSLIFTLPVHISKNYQKEKNEFTIKKYQHFKLIYKIEEDITDNVIIKKNNFKLIYYINFFILQNKILNWRNKFNYKECKQELYIEVYIKPKSELKQLFETDYYINSFFKNIPTIHLTSLLNQCGNEISVDQAQNFIFKWDIDKKINKDEKRYNLYQIERPFTSIMIIEHHYRAPKNYKYGIPFFDDIKNYYHLQLENLLVTERKHEDEQKNFHLKYKKTRFGNFTSLCFNDFEKIIDLIDKIKLY